MLAKQVLAVDIVPGRLLKAPVGISLSRVVFFLRGMCRKSQGNSVRTPLARLATRGHRLRQCEGEASMILVHGSF